MNASQNQFKTKHYLSAILLLALSLSLFAADDPSIKGNLRDNIQQSMQSYIDHQTIDGHMYVFDSHKGKLLKLTLDELHSGIVKKGNFYVSCADFKDQDNRKIDMDFLVRASDGKLITTQGIVHSVDGKKRKYHLEKI